MRLQSFKHYCPECGEEIKLMKAANGNYFCSACACEYTRSWLPWLVVGIPGTAWGLLMVGSLPGVSLWKVPPGVLYLGGAILIALFWIWGHREFRIVRHGREYVESPTDASGS